MLIGIYLFFYHFRFLFCFLSFSCFAFSPYCMQKPRYKMKVITVNMNRTRSGACKASAIVL